MADEVNAKNSDAKFRPHSEGQYPGMCVDVVDLGESVSEFVGKPKKLVPKCAIVFRTGETNPETGSLIDIAVEYTVSMGDLANLRRDLEAWRGKKYTPEQIEEGVPLHKLVGNWALLTIEHATSRKGRKYAKVNSLTGVPAMMRAHLPELPTYKREDYWAQKKESYLAAANAFREEIGVPGKFRIAGDDPGPEDMGDDDSVLPF